MKKRNIIYGSVLLITCLLLLYFSPDYTSMFFVGLMVVLLFLGFILGLNRTLDFSNGLKHGMQELEELKKLSVEDNWVYVKQNSTFFNNYRLDTVLKKYIKKVDTAKIRSSILLPDIEDFINEEFFTIKGQRNFVAIIPGTLTGLGILGTFYGLISGLDGIKFSSVDVVVDSITVLVNGIDTAFYTSIAGVLLSIIFDIMNKISWNDLMETMLDFYERFHESIIESKEIQKENLQLAVYETILSKKERNEKNEAK